MKDLKKENSGDKRSSVNVDSSSGSSKKPKSTPSGLSSPSSPSGTQLSESDTLLGSMPGSMLDDDDTGHLIYSGPGNTGRVSPILEEIDTEEIKYKIFEDLEYYLESDYICHIDLPLEELLVEWAEDFGVHKDNEQALLNKFDEIYDNINLTYYNKISQLNDLKRKLMATGGGKRNTKKKKKVGGDCDANCTIKMEHYNNDANDTIDEELKIRIIADNDKDFNKRSSSVHLKACLKAGEEAIEQGHKIDKNEIFQLTKKELNDNFKTMVIEGEQLEQMVSKQEQINLPPGSYTIIDTTPNGLGFMIEASSVKYTVINAFDSASFKTASIQIEGADITLANFALNFLKRKYKSLDIFTSIEIINCNLSTDVPTFTLRFKYNGGTRDIEIETGPNGELSVPRILRTILQNDRSACARNLITLITTLFPGEPQKMMQTFNTLLIYFKCAGDFLKIWFGFNYGDAELTNLLTTCDISLFNIAMHFNMNLAHYKAKANFKKPCWVILGTGSASGKTKSKRIVYANNDAYFLSKSLQQLVEEKLKYNYYYESYDNGGVKIQSYLLVEYTISTKEYKILKKKSGPEISATMIPGDIFTFTENTGAPAVKYFYILVDDSVTRREWVTIINDDNLKESKGLYSKIIKSAESFIALTELTLTKNKVKQYITGIKSKLKFVTRFDQCIRLWPERSTSIDAKFNSVIKFLNVITPYFMKLKDILTELPLLTEMEKYIEIVSRFLVEEQIMLSVGYGRGVNNFRIELYNKFKSYLEELKDYIKNVLLSQNEGDTENPSLPAIFDVWIHNITPLNDEHIYPNPNHREQIASKITMLVGYKEACQQLLQDPVQGGPAQGGPAQGGPAQGGPAQGGPAQGGPAQGGSIKKINIKTKLNKTKKVLDNVEPSKNKTKKVSDKVEPSKNKSKKVLDKVEPSKNRTKKISDKVEPSKNKTKKVLDKVEPSKNKTKKISKKKEKFNLLKYKQRIDEYKNKNLSKYFINKINKYLKDDNININNIGLIKFKTIIKDIYKIS